jgi:MarR family transcriptional regulator, transcriptional regulator for hemolysin
MNKTDSIPDKQMIFALLMIISNRMVTLLGREFKNYDVTTKQWFLIAIIESLFDNPPTMKAIAGEMGSSHQNIKQIALKLQEKGLLKLEKDKKDARATRLIMTEQSYLFWKKLHTSGSLFMQNMFKNIQSKDLTTSRNLLQQIQANLVEMENATLEETD